MLIRDDVQVQTTGVIAPDLGEWLGSDRLIRAVIEVVDEQPPLSRNALAAAQGRILLGLLVYSYARGIFFSRQIERLILSDHALSRSAPAWLVDSAQIRNFRRHHKQPLQESLAALLSRAAMESARTNRSSAGLLDQSEFARAAEERVNRAVLFDTMDFDD